LSSLANTYAKGRYVEKCTLPLGTDNIMVVLLQNTSLPADTTLVNYQNLGAMLAVAVEATFSNYARANLSSSSILITRSTSSSPTSVTVSFAQQIFASAGGALNNTISKVALVYQPTSSTPDSGCLILATLDYSGTTTGGELIVTLGTLTDA
jgi:hypothetical protein